jgi:dynein light chain 1, axonemal
MFMVPPIDKMDPAVLNNLVKCTKLSLSSNSIEKMVNLPNMRNLEILSLARNNIKKIGGLDEIGNALIQVRI